VFKFFSILDPGTLSITALMEELKKTIIQLKRMNIFIVVFLLIVFPYWTIELMAKRKQPM
jgi:hypothetical protein